MTTSDQGSDEERPGASPPEGGAPVPSWGNISEHHWSRSRKGMNEEALEYYRERSRAPGVAEGGSHRNHYCMSCNGVLPLEYDQRQPASKEHGTCPHCGAELESNVRAMFNWVEIDQVPSSDLRALAPILIGLVALIVGAAVLLIWML